MRKLPVVLSCLATILVTACGGGSISGSFVDKYLAEEEVPAPAAALPTPEDLNPVPYVEDAVDNKDFTTIPETETSQILTTANFLFDTAKSVRLQVNLSQAHEIQSSLSLCTVYEQTEAGYFVDYNSCAVKASLENGQFEYSMKMVNQFDSVIAVVWFPGQEFSPLYNELKVADLTQGESGYVWDWTL